MVQQIGANLWGQYWSDRAAASRLSKQLAFEAYNQKLRMQQEALAQSAAQSFADEQRRAQEAHALRLQELGFANQAEQTQAAREFQSQQAQTGREFEAGQRELDRAQQNELAMRSEELRKQGMDAEAADRQARLELERKRLQAEYGTEAFPDQTVAAPADNLPPMDPRFTAMVESPIPGQEPLPAPPVTPEASAQMKAEQAAQPAVPAEESAPAEKRAAWTEEEILDDPKGYVESIAGAEPPRSAGRKAHEEWRRLADNAWDDVRNIRSTRSAEKRQAAQIQAAIDRDDKKSVRVLTETARENSSDTIVTVETTPYASTEEYAKYKAELEEELAKETPDPRRISEINRSIKAGAIVYKRNADNIDKARNDVALNKTPSEIDMNDPVYKKAYMDAVKNSMNADFRRYEESSPVSAGAELLAGGAVNLFSEASEKYTSASVHIRSKNELANSLGERGVSVSEEDLKALEKRIGRGSFNRTIVGIYNKIVDLDNAVKSARTDQEKKIAIAQRDAAREAAREYLYSGKAQLGATMPSESLDPAREREALRAESAAIEAEKKGDMAESQRLRDLAARIRSK